MAPATKVEVMISPHLRILALVLLILSFAMFTGVVTTVSALEHPEVIDTCCDRGESESDPMNGFCLDANCLCFSCLNLEVTAPLFYSCPQQVTAAVFCPSWAFNPDGFSVVIDYPPETA
jgi:hypothetical protein